MSVELFDRVVTQGGQLLKAELRPRPPAKDETSVLLLTFDVGRLAVRADPSGTALTVEPVDPGEAAATGPARGQVDAAHGLVDAAHGLVDAAEEEPWWRVLGSPLARVWPGGDALEGGVCLQFRADDDSPRIITLAPHAECVVIRLENPPESA